MMDIAKLSETRKADRFKIAELVAKVLDEYKVEYTWKREGFDDCYKHAQTFAIRAAQGCCLHIEIDGESCQPNVHVLPWHMARDVDTRFADAFGDINRFHFSKMTGVAYGTDGLLLHLRQKLELIKAGLAFSAEREAAAILKNGTAAERMARWEEYRAELAAQKEAAA